MTEVKVPPLPLPLPLPPPRPPPPPPSPCGQWSVVPGWWSLVGQSVLTPRSGRSLTTTTCHWGPLYTLNTQYYLSTDSVPTECPLPTQYYLSTISVLTQYYISTDLVPTECPLPTQYYLSTNSVAADCQLTPPAGDHGDPVSRPRRRPRSLRLVSLYRESRVFTVNLVYLL